MIRAMDQIAQGYDSGDGGGLVGGEPYPCGLLGGLYCGVNHFLVTRIIQKTCVSVKCTPISGVWLVEGSPLFALRERWGGAKGPRRVASHFWDDFRFLFRVADPKIANTDPPSKWLIGNGLGEGGGSLFSRPTHPVWPYGSTSYG